MLTGPGGMSLGFITLDDREAPAWPNEARDTIRVTATGAVPPVMLVVWLLG